MTISYAVTGAAGCIGRALLEYLTGIEGNNVLGIDLAPRPADFPNVEWAQCNILNPSSYSDRLSGVHTVIHLAAKAHGIPATRPCADEIWRVNFEGTEKVIKAACSAGVRKFLLVSTVSVGSPRTGGGTDAYADSKLAAEESVLEFSDRMGVLIARPTTVYGPHDKGNIFKLIRWIDRGLPPVVGNGQNLKSLVFVRNLAAALAFLAQKGGEKEIYVVTDGRDLSIQEIVEAIGRFLGKKNPWPTIPVRVAKVLASTNEWMWQAFGAELFFSRDIVEKLTEESIFDSAPLFSLGFHPAYSFEEGMKETVQWYKRSGPSRSA